MTLSSPSGNNPDTRAWAQRAKDLEEWERKRRERESQEYEAKLRGDTSKSKFGGDRHMPADDARLSTILRWSGIVTSTLASIAIVWVISTMVSLDKNMAILLARPIPVSKEQYDSDMDTLRVEQRNIRAQLETIQNRQQASLGR